MTNEYSIKKHYTIKSSNKHYVRAAEMDILNNFSQFSKDINPRCLTWRTFLQKSSFLLTWSYKMWQKKRHYIRCRRNKIATIESAECSKEMLCAFEHINNYRHFGAIPMLHTWKTIVLGTIEGFIIVRFSFKFSTTTPWNTSQTLENVATSCS